MTTSTWSEPLIVDSTLKKVESLIKKNLPSKQGLMAFLKHCCTCRHYFLRIKKCGSHICGICKPVKLPMEVFESLYVLPDPVPSDNRHHKTLEELHGTQMKSTDFHFRRHPNRRQPSPFQLVSSM